MSHLLPLFMGAVLGFAAHRAGLCTVKAVAELLTTGRAHFLWSFAKSALWVLAGTAFAGALSFHAGFSHWPLTVASVIGGFVFGLGAGLNGGCTFSTLSRLADGNLSIFATVAGWAVGIAIGLRLWAHATAPPVSMPAGPGLGSDGPSSCSWPHGPCGRARD